jgi:hypothetical protein
VAFPTITKNPYFSGYNGCRIWRHLRPAFCSFRTTLNGSLILNPYPSVSGTRLFRAPIYFGYLSLIFPSVSKGSSNLPIIVASFSPHHACEFASFWNSGPLSHLLNAVPFHQRTNLSIQTIETMPSPFKIRETLRLKPRPDGSQQLNVVSLRLARTPSPTLPGTAIRCDKPHALSLWLPINLTHGLTFPLIQVSLTTRPSTSPSSNTWRSSIKLKELPSRKPIRTFQLKTSSQRSGNLIAHTMKRQHVDVVRNQSLDF